MIPGSFDYHRPTSVDEAVGLISSLGDDATVVAGGHSLIPMMKLRMAAPDHLVDLRDVAGLNTLSVSGGAISIGAMVTQAELINSDELHAVCPILRETSLQIADPQIRNLGTLGGNVANGDPGNDMPAVMQTLDAVFVLHGPKGPREVKARDFYEGAFFTARQPDEILAGIQITAPAAGHGYSYRKQKRKIGDYATAAAAVVLTMNGGTVASAAIGLTNVSDAPLFAEEASNIVMGSSLDDAAIAQAVAAAKAITDPAEDGRGPREFRTHVCGVMVERALREAAQRAA